jgi:hypothetical protein
VGGGAGVELTLGGTAVALALMTGDAEVADDAAEVGTGVLPAVDCEVAGLPALSPSAEQESVPRSAMAKGVVLVRIIDSDTSGGQRSSARVGRSAVTKLSRVSHLCALDESGFLAGWVRNPSSSLRPAQHGANSTASP